MNMNALLNLFKNNLFVSLDKMVAPIRFLTQANNSSEWIVSAYSKFSVMYLICMLTPVFIYWLINGDFDANHRFHPCGIT